MVWRLLAYSGAAEALLSQISNCSYFFVLGELTEGAAWVHI